MGVRVRDVVNKWCCVANRLERPDPDRGIASFLYTMYRGGMTGVKEKVELTPAEDNPWYEFLLETIVLDYQNSKSYGWHWLWTFYLINEKNSRFLYYFKEINGKLPDWHPLKEKNFHIPAFPEKFKKRVDALMVSLGSPTEIKKIDFSKLNFVNVADLGDTIFPICVSFDDSNFASESWFKRAIFFADRFNPAATFINTTFSGDADFNNAIFFSQAHFNRATFSNYISFCNTLFSDSVTFGETTFSRRTDFTEAKFSGTVSFSRAKFSAETFFKNVHFCSFASFQGASFKNQANFNQVKITGHTDFTRARFNIIAPVFHNASLCSDIIWDGITWPDDKENDFNWSFNKKHDFSWSEIKIIICSWMEIKKLVFNKVARKKLIYDWLDIDILKQRHQSQIRYNQNAYETLAYHMENLDKYHDQHLFFRKETHCRRLLERNRLMYFSYWLYEKLADYGYGVELAFRYWRWHIYFGAGILAILAFINAWRKGWEDGVLETTKSMLCSLPISFSNAHGFLPFHNGPLKLCYEYFMDNSIFNAIWVFQTIAGIPLLFLVLLTLRIRFRLK